MAFATFGFLPCVIAFRAARFGGFDRLAIDNDDARRGLPSFGLTDGHDQDTDDLFPSTAVAPRIKAVLHSGEGRKVLRQKAPRTTGADQVKQGIEDLSRIGRLTSAGCLAAGSNGCTSANSSSDRSLAC